MTVGKQPTIIVLMNEKRIKLMPVMFSTVMTVVERGASSTEEPQPPTRKVHVYGGETSEPIRSLEDLTGLEDHEQYDEWKQSFLIYRAQRQEWSRKRGAALTRLAAVRGVLPVDEGDKVLNKEQLLDGISQIMDITGLEPLPIEDVRAIYLSHVAFSTPEEMTDVIQRQWFELCLPDNEEVQAQYAGFLDNSRQPAVGVVEATAVTEV